MAAVMFKVASVDAASQSVKTFRLVRFDRKPVLPFAPGAHVVVTVKDAASGLQGSRAYTLTSRPEDVAGYEISVARGTREQGISAFLHLAARPGRVVTVSEPVHGFGLAPQAGRHLLVAGGIGITPMLALARQLEQAGTGFDLFYSGKTEADMPFLDELRAMRHATCTVVTTAAPAMGRLDLQAILAHAPSGTHAYVCGPAGMIRDVQRLTQALGWNGDRVHCESFDAAASLDDRAFDVVLARSGRALTVPPGQSILDALLAAEVPVDYDCRHGACGRCTQAVLQGEPDHKDALYSGDAEQNGWIRICVSRARSAKLVLDL